ncbi:hypothetical protein Scep_001221 [Stephania cephalantha]|uniref:Uncharacterized protein n=1 Tax=Stephania cephalantha TaxID=152367 RepID=A0AAP0Q3L0_9MAGN
MMYQRYKTTPSYVAFTDTECLIANAAKNQVVMNLITGFGMHVSCWTLLSATKWWKN